MQNTGFLEKEWQMAQRAYEIVMECLIKYGFQALYGLVVLFLGFKAGGWASRATEGLCQKRHVDVAMGKFLAGMVKTFVIAFATLIAPEKFGITIPFPQREVRVPGAPNGSFACI